MTLSNHDICPCGVTHILSGEYMCYDMQMSYSNNVTLEIYGLGSLYKTCINTLLGKGNGISTIKVYLVLIYEL